MTVVAEKPDSQDVCFITSARGREQFLGDRIEVRPGRVVDTSGDEIGQVAHLSALVDQHFGSPHETQLTKQFDKPVFVYGYPTQVKAFYMEPWPGRPEVCKSVDLLAPEGYGEITGGSERMSDADTLIAAIERHDLPMENYEWYVDLRRYGTVPHSGFGLGLERAVQFITGMGNIRDVIPFPRTPNSIEF